MYSLHADRGFLCRVSPFRYLRINGYLLLPEAFRSLSRLSSALSAKASTLRPYYFNRSRNDRISWFSVSSLMYSVTSAGFVFFHFPISLLTMKFEFLWCLDSFPFLKMNSILILVWSFQGTSVFQKQYPVSATLLVSDRPYHIRTFSFCSYIRSSIRSFIRSGSHLSSRAVSSQVLSAASVLTIVFGMGTGVTPTRIATGIWSFKPLTAQQ